MLGDLKHHSSRIGRFERLEPFDVSGQTFYDACQVPLLFFYVACRILCRAMLAKW
jgi:hypothetical protein